MKKFFAVGIFILSSTLTVFAATQKLSVPRLKTIGGAFKHPVLSQTAPEFVAKRAGITMLRRYYIAKWGVNRFEYGMAEYHCKTSRCEMVGDPIALKVFEECTGFGKKGQPICKGLQSARVDIIEPAVTSGNAKRSWYTCADYGSNCNDQNELSEFPDRYSPEDSENPTGI